MQVDEHGRVTQPTREQPILTVHVQEDPAIYVRLGNGAADKAAPVRRLAGAAACRRACAG